MARAGDDHTSENASHGGPAQVDALPVPEQLGDVGVVGAGAGGADQLHYRVGLVVSNGVA